MPLRYRAPVGQLSLFSADVASPTLEDLGGLLAAHGQITRSSHGCRLSILLTQQWRAAALQREFERRGLGSSISAGQDGTGQDGTGQDDTGQDGIERADADRPDSQPSANILLRSDRSAALDPLADAWTCGSAKTVPAFPVAAGGLLRCWVLAAGRSDELGFLLGTDPHAAQTYPRLAAGLAGIGVTGAVIGGRGGGPGVRIVGKRRLDRLAELLGAAPADAPDGTFPTGR
jgi:hypothetical protein